MTEYQLELYCERHSLCDCDCLRCPALAAFWRTELGLDECDDEDDEAEDADKDYDACD